MNTESRTKLLLLIFLSPDYPSTPPVPARRYSRLTQGILDLIKEKPTEEWTYEKVLNTVNDSRESAGRIRFKKSSWFPVIVEIMHSLEVQGYLVKRPTRFNAEQQSFAWLDEGQRSLFVDLLTVLYQFQERDEDTWRKGRAIAVNISERDANLLLAKARKASPSANKLPLGQSKSFALEFIEQHPGSTILEVKKFIEGSQERHLSRGTIQAILNMLKKDGEAEVVNEKGVGKWSLASQQQS